MLPHSQSKVETVAENHFGDEMIGRGGDAEAEIDLPFRGEIQVDSWKNLVLLKAGGQEVRGWTY